MNAHERRSRRHFLRTTPPLFAAALLAACAAPAPTAPAPAPTAAPKPTTPASAPLSPAPSSAASPGASVAASVQPSPSAAASPRPAGQQAPAQAAAAAPGALDHFRFISWSTPRTEQAHIFVADDLGFFREQGIDFEYVPGQGAGDAVKQLLAGNGDVAFAGAEGVFFTADQGGKVMGIYNSHPQNLFVLAALPNKNVKTPADLKDKKIGVLSMASGGRYNVLTVLAANGLQESDVTLVATGPAPGPFLQGQVDVWSTITTSLAPLIRVQNLQGVTQIAVKDYANTPTETLIVSGNTFANKRELVTRFLKAIRKGQDYTLQNVEQAAQIAVKHGLDVTDVNPAVEIVKAFNDASQTDATRQHGLGWFEMDVIQKAADLYTASGLLQNKIDVNTYFTNELVTTL